MKTAFLLDIPVLHQGYLKLFEKYPEVKHIYLIGKDLADQLRPEHSAPEIRALATDTMQQVLSSLKIFDQVDVVTVASIKQLNNLKIITTDERISRQLVDQYLASNEVTFDSAFLRWDEDSVLSLHDINFNSETIDEFDIEVIKRISSQAQGSSDWWRQVGAAVVRNREIILESHNQHLPSENAPYINGDPRDFVQAGTNSQLSSAIHAEQAIIAEAARKGLSLDGASIYVTVFPCPVCAKLIACSGIKKCYFASGHASLDGEEVLKSYNVELIKVSFSQ